MYPALSIASEFRTGAEVLWVGGLGGMEADLVPRAGWPFRGIHGGGLHGVGWRTPLNFINLVRGLTEAIGIVRAFRPDAALVTGGFITVPAALAAWLNHVPVLIYLPDIEPALAVKAITPFARKIAVTTDTARPYFTGRNAAKVVVTGYPTRPELREVQRADAMQHLHLAPERKTILVTGGSRGARSLNRATVAALPEWLRAHQVVHLSGTLDWPEVEQAREHLPAALRPHYHAFPYLHEMEWALAAADVVVSRAGASALGEYPLFGLPAVLVPYPYAWRYQKVNADYLVARGAALCLNDEALTDHLTVRVSDLLSHPERLRQMQTAARQAATPEAAQHIARELRSLSNRP